VQLLFAQQQHVVGFRRGAQAQQQQQQQQQQGMMPWGVFCMYS
jgi:hypothetical protein